MTGRRRARENSYNQGVLVKRILLVDDDISVLQLLARALTSYDLTVAHDGQEALAVASGRPLDLLITDYLMPEMTGDDATTSAALDFLALGTARWWLRDLTIGMGHIEVLDVESLTREALSGAHAWQTGDRPAAEDQNSTLSAIDSRSSGS